MPLFKNITLAQKLVALVAFFLAVVLLVGATGLAQLRAVSAAQREMYTDTVVPLRKVVDGGRQAAVHFRRMYPFILKTDAKSREETLSLNQQSEQSVLDAIGLLRQDDGSAELRATGQKLADTWARYKASVARLQAAAQAGDAEAAMGELNASTDRLHVEVRNLLLEAGKLQEQQARDETERVAASVDRTFRIVSALIAAGAVLGGCWAGGSSAPSCASWAATRPRQRRSPARSRTATCARASRQARATPPAWSTISRPCACNWPR